MEAEHTENVAEKAVTYVKEMLGIHPAEVAADAEANPEYADIAPEITAEDAMRLDPNAYAMDSIEQMDADSHISPETQIAFERDLGGAPTQASLKFMGETDAEHLRREEEEHRQKSAFELNSESARFEDGE